MLKVFTWGCRSWHIMFKVKQHEPHLKLGKKLLCYLLVLFPYMERKHYNTLLDSWIHGLVVGNLAIGQVNAYKNFVSFIFLDYNQIFETSVVFDRHCLSLCLLLIGYFVDCLLIGYFVDCLLIGYFVDCFTIYSFWLSLLYLQGLFSLTIHVYVRFNVF
jgi:hypothetical protein